jgi:hypothetical protein
MFVLSKSEGVQQACVPHRNPFRVWVFSKWARFPGLPKLNPGLQLANAFSVELKLDQPTTTEEHMAAKKTKKESGAGNSRGSKKSGGSKKASKKSTRVSPRGLLNQAKKAIGKVAVAAAKGAAVGALQGAVEEGSNVKGVQQLKQASKKSSNGSARKTSKGAAKKTSKKK